MSDARKANGAYEAPAGTTGGAGALDRILDRPAAFIVTALILVAIFGATFISNPDRVAPGDDPAFYTWRTETLMSEEPSVLLEETGPRDVLAGGYRLSTPIIGSYLRQGAGVAMTSMTIVLTVAVRVLIALLLAGFAYRYSSTIGFYRRKPGLNEPGKQRDPVIFHAVALTVGSLMLAPPFFGYLDNLLCLLFLTSSLFLLDGLRTSWGARVGFAALLVLAGLTHPTTLVFFCAVLGAAAGLRLLLRRFDLRSVIRDDAPMLLSAFAAVVVTYAIWKIGAWGPAVSLSEAAVPPPATQDFFETRLFGWIDQLRPLLNGPLLILGLMGLLVAGRDAFEREFSRITIMWLLPLAGVFGFLAGLSYPYYRFFNTTVAWVLLAGLGAGLLVRLFLTSARRTNPLPLIGVFAVLAIIGTNFTSGLERWTAPDEGWLTDQQVTDFRALRVALEEEGQDRPVVFVLDSDATEPVRIYGFMKFSANVSRAGLPHGYLDRGYVYLGSLDNLIRDEPTEGANDDYLEISTDTLDDALEGIERTGKDPIVVLASTFNQTGANAEIVPGEFNLVQGGDRDTDIWSVSDGEVYDWSVGAPIVSDVEEEDSNILHLFVVLLGLALLMIPGYIWFRGALPDAGLAEGLGLVPALSLAMLTVSGFVVVAVTRTSFTTPFVWAGVVLAAAGAFFLTRSDSTAT